MIELCMICKKEKEVCCSYHPLNGKGEYAYCKDCCKWKPEHIKDRDRITVSQPEPKFTLEQRVLELEERMKILEDK